MRERFSYKELKLKINQLQDEVRKLQSEIAGNQTQHIEQKLTLQIRYEEEFEILSRYEKVRVKIWETAADTQLKISELIDKLINVVGEALSLSRVSFSTIGFPEGIDLVNLQWCGKDVDPVAVPNIPNGLYSLCQENRIIEVIRSDIPCYPEEVSAYWADHQIKSYLATVFKFNNCEGLLSFHDCVTDRMWTEYEKYVLSELARVILIKNDQAVAAEERKKLELQLHQVQKMESIGTLAGGIAHDFNNLLMGIQGNASLLSLALGEDSSYNKRLKNIEQYVHSGAELTKQLLGFARKGKYEVKPIAVTELLRSTVDMFGRTKKELIVSESYEDEEWMIEADKGQLEHVLINLFVNASQAMPNGGKLSIETETVVLDKQTAALNHVKSGRFIRITVTDTGVGMDEATKSRIFEPFFTTKGMGRGVGLGLASAYGIIKNHGGNITVFSEKSRGSSFTIYLPVSGKKRKGEKTQLSEEILEGTETVLLVDDEDMIIDVGSEILKTLGYKVLSVHSGMDAIKIYREQWRYIDMVILDMVMPAIGGSETFDQIKKINPDVKVLLSSGYNLNDEAEKIMQKGCGEFIHKPFNIEELSQKVRKVLED